NRFGRAALALELERAIDGAAAPRDGRAQRQRAVRAGARALAAPGTSERTLVEHAGERDGARVAGRVLQEVRGGDAELLGNRVYRRPFGWIGGVQDTIVGAAERAARDAGSPAPGRGRR